MNKDRPKSSPNKNDESTEEEIIEDISIAEEFSDDADSDDIPIFLNDDNEYGDKKRQLFDIEDDKFFLEDVDNIAKHFKPPLETNREEVKENIVPINRSTQEKSQKNSKNVNESAHFKDISPLKDDVILINDKKVSISSLKKVQIAETEVARDSEIRSFSSLNFPKVPAAVSLRTSHSLDLDISLDSTDSLESVENDNSVDEIVERYDYQSSGASASDEDKELLKEQTMPSIVEQKQEIVVKKMEKITPEYLKEPLDDITEEESEAESKEHPMPSPKNIIIEKGSQMRAILENSLLADRVLDKNESAGGSHSLDLQNKSLKELQDIVIEKDYCLDALNLQLTSLVRREHFKDGTGRDSFRESAPFSIATSASTEYRTINEEFNLKILDIENELHERATCIEQLKEKLEHSIQERDQLQTESEKLVHEVHQLRTKIAGIESLKNSDEDRTVISASKINDFKNSLSEEESECFSKVWTKFENFHRMELDQLKICHDEEIKCLKKELKNDKKETEVEVNRLRQLLSNVKSSSPDVDELRRELEAKHSKEMEELREYFEKRCVDMEKQYSEDVFSQHSRRMEDVNTDDSDNETLPDDDGQNLPKESPVHRRSLMEASAISSAIGDENPFQTVDDIRQFYLEKINEMTRCHDEIVKDLKMKLQKHENRQDHGEEFLSYSNDEHPAQIDNNSDNELNRIIKEYEQRLEQQVALAREDVLQEIENHIQALLSENTRDDSHWPAELILLREKLTAKSQLEIAQLKIKHEEEMAKIKSDYDIQLQRRQKRHAAFDAHRDLDKIINERDNLRELSSSLRLTLCELAKYFVQCEDDINNTLLEGLNKTNESIDELNQSALSNTTPRRLITFKPDISSLITIVEDPQLLEFIARNSDDIGGVVQINIVDCLERLKLEANNILGLSEQLCKRNKFDVSIDKLSDKTDSCEEEDGLKRSRCKSLESYEKIHNADKTENAIQSLPACIEKSEAAELNQHLMELKNLLMKSAEEKRDLQMELSKVLRTSDSLEQRLHETQSQLESLNVQRDAQKEIVTEGFGTQSIENLQNKSFSLMELQEKAKAFLTASPNNSTVDNAVLLYQLIEDFCRETDRYMEFEKNDRDDLQSQIEAADKQLKATRQFLEDQAAEREQERDEFSKEIEKLRQIVKEKDKDKSSQDSCQKEKVNGSDIRQIIDYIANLEHQIKDLSGQIVTFGEQKAKYEQDLKASIDKVFDLREIIADLETQVQSKTINEHVLNEKCKELQSFIELQNQTNESLKLELDGTKAAADEMGYAERIQYLEEQLKLTRPSAEQKLLIDQMTSQLKTIEMLLDRKTKTLEAFHALASTCSTTCSSPSEDVSRGGMEYDGSDRSPLRIIKMSTEGSALPFDEVQRILEKLSKHNRVEEATVKKVTDLEMQFNGIKENYTELQQEKDILQERMSEQLVKISSLQSRLDEQRLRAEELNKQSTSDLTIRVHDLQNELSSLRETLTARDKQIANLNQLLEHSKRIIDRQEHELAYSGDNDKSLVERLEDELKRKTDEIQRLKDKIKTEMVNKATLPDLLETMMAEKNEEIENLHEQLINKEREVMILQNRGEMTFTKVAETSSTPPASCAGGTILSMISEYDEPDMLRRMAEMDDDRQLLQNQMLLQAGPKLDNQTFHFTQSTQSEILTGKATNNTTTKEVSPLMMPSQVHLIPRQINFSSTDESSIMHDVNKLRHELDQITYEKNAEIEMLKAELQKQIDAMSNIQLDLAARTKLYDDLMTEKKEIEKELDDVRLEMMKFSSYEMTLKKKEEELNNSRLKLQQLEMALKSQNQDLDNLKIVLNEKDENLQKLSEDFSLAQAKCKDNERILMDLERLKHQVTSYHDVMTEKENLMKKLELDLIKYVKSEKELLEKAEQCDKLLESNQNLESDVGSLKRELSLKSFALEKCKFDLQEMEQKVDSLKNIDAVEAPPSSDRQMSVDEITARLDRELNYSAELDGNIIKAIESESEVNSELEELGGKRPSRYESKMKRLEEELQDLKKQYENISTELDDEKRNSDAIQMQDASLIEAIKIRLEQALDNEMVLKKLLEAERNKTETLSSQLTGIQRTKSFDNYLLFNKSSLADSPRRLAKLNEFESEVVARLESEIKLITSQNEREKDRVNDLQKVLDKERDRFTKAIADQQEYSDQMKKEIKRLVNDKEILENELDQLHDLKMKYFDLEREKDKLMETIRALRNDVDRGSKRETKLAEALLKENDGQCDSVPEQFMQKLKEINKSLSDNVRENHQLAETLSILTEERRALQQKIADLENAGNMVHYHHQSNQDLEERANHVFGKYLRSESFRKALIYQKKFLLITIATSFSPGLMTLPLFKGDPNRKKTFRSIVLVVIAIERMKFVSRRWTGKRMLRAKTIFSSPPKRSQSATNNHWAIQFDTNYKLTSSPPSRDRPGFQLPSPPFLMKPVSAMRNFGASEERIQSLFNRDGTNH